MRTLCSVGEGAPLTVIISAIIKIMAITIIIRIQNASSDSILAMIEIMAITIIIRIQHASSVYCVYFGCRETSEGVIGTGINTQL